MVRAMTSMTSVTWEAVQKLLQRPAELSVRVISVEVGTAREFGAGKMQINPWLDSCALGKLSAVQFEDAADELTSYGMPLSLAMALQQPVQDAVQAVLLSLLKALVHHSIAAREQLNAYRKIPFKLGSIPKAHTPVAKEIEKLCSQSFSGSVHTVAKDWTGFSSIYEVWLSHAGQKLKVQVRGETNKSAAFDLGGVHLTGGRVWAGSLLLAQWLMALHCEDTGGQALQLQDGPVLELGAGLGLAGICAAKLGHRVVLSDREPVLLDRLQENARLNDVDGNCRVLNLEWAEAFKKRRMLGAQNFSTVIGADVVYSELGGDLLVKLLSIALPHGGLALFMNAAKHRAGIDTFVKKLIQAGHTAIEGRVPCGQELQELVCGSFEPEQQYLALAVVVSPKRCDA